MDIFLKKTHWNPIIPLSSKKDRLFSREVCFIDLVKPVKGPAEGQ